MPSPLLRQTWAEEQRPGSGSELPNGGQVCPGWRRTTAPTRQLLHSRAWKAGTQPNPRNKSVFFKGEAGKIKSRVSFPNQTQSVKWKAVFYYPHSLQLQAGRLGRLAQHRECVKKLCAGELLGKPSATLRSSTHSIYVDLRKDSRVHKPEIMMHYFFQTV